MTLSALCVCSDDNNDNYNASDNDDGPIAVTVVFYVVAVADDSDAIVFHGQVINSYKNGFASVCVCVCVCVCVRVIV